MDNGLFLLMIWMRVGARPEMRMAIADADAEEERGIIHCSFWIYQGLVRTEARCSC
jgi:hypothetical protein